LSIRTRLTLWYTGLLAISLLAFDLLVYSALSNILMAATDERLATQAQAVLDQIDAENDPMAIILSGRAKLPSFDVFGSQFYIQIADLNKQVVQLSDNLRGQPLPVLPTSETSSGQSWVTVNARQGVRLRVLSRPIVLAGRLAGTIQVAQSQVALDDTLLATRNVLAIASLSLLLLAAVGGAFLARAALHPIQTITQTTRRITQAQDLSQRIPVTVPNDEVGRLTETINGMLARLEELFKAQQRLVADVSHDLRTPLTTIQGNVDLLRRGAADDPATRASTLRAIADETARMRRLVNDLLLLAQADAGLKLYRLPVEVDTLLLEVYRQAQGLAQGVTVRLGAEDQASVSGDADRLRQLLLNLVDNALKHAPAGSGEVTLTLRRSGGWVQVGVEDNGAGIPPEDLPHIFERFYRADPSRSRPGGSGLGLAIAKWVAEAHGGRIEVESQVGRGSTFTVWLPELTPSPQPGLALVPPARAVEPRRADTGPWSATDLGEVSPPQAVQEGGEPGQRATGGDR
jgi:two-component system OmpR family sensor kinase